MRGDKYSYELAKRLNLNEWAIIDERNSINQRGMFAPKTAAKQYKELGKNLTSIKMEELKC